MFTKKQIFVWGSETSMILLAAVFLWLGYHFFPISPPASGSIGDRFTFILPWFLLPALSIILGVFLVMYERFVTEAINPLASIPETKRMKVFQKYMQNTLEQSVIFILANFALLSVVDLQNITLLPLLAVIFMFGRILFLLGYLYNPIARAPGFALTFYPSVLSIFYTLFKILT